MKYNININQTKCIEFGLNLQQGAIMDIMSQLSTWADPISTEQGIYYYLSSGKLVDELPIISDNKDTFQKNIKTLKDKGLLDHYYDIKNSKGYYRLSSKGKTFVLQEKNPEGSGKKSLPPQEKNPDNNITNNNIHSLTSNEVNSFINNSFTNELLVNKNSDIVELNNKESSFVKLNNNKDELLINNNCKVKENKIKESPFDVNEVFDKLWVFYPGKKNAKEAARTYFKKKIKTQYDLDLLRYALPLYIDTVKDKNYLVLLRTYLSEERYKDYEQQFKNTNKTLDKEIKQQDNEGFKLKFNRTYEN